jgi:hypothetical protein
LCGFLSGAGFPLPNSCESELPNSAIVFILTVGAFFDRYLAQMAKNGGVWAEARSPNPS